MSLATDTGMTRRVRLLPSQREFDVAPQETLLEGALRAGLSPGYRCGNGSCGECKARVSAGRVGRLRPHDYPFSAADREAGCILLCCAGAETDLEVTTEIAAGVDDLPLQSIAARVAKLETLGPDRMAVHLRTPRSQALRFLAGQHVRLEIAGLPPRHKSLASCPCSATHLEFHFRRSPNDAFAAHVFGGLRIGDAVQVSGPHGRFVLREQAGRPAILLAYDTGFAAIKSLIEQAMAVDYPHALHLYWVTDRDGGHYADNYCRAVADAHGNFTYTALRCDRDTADRSPSEHGLLHGAQRIVADHPQLQGFELYASGPDANMRAAREWLCAHGLPPEQLYVDDLARASG